MSDGGSGRQAEIGALAVAGGGTGGHLFPGLAIIEEFRRRCAGIRTLYIGVKGKLEERAVPEAGIEFYGLTMSGLKGRGLLRAPSGILLAGRAVFECRRRLSAFGPDLLVGVGGYSSGPAAVAAWSLGVPLVIQEQNTVPGSTNRLLGKFARRIFLAFEGAAGFFPPERTVVTGNPIRGEALVEPSEVGRGDELQVLVLGGSRGARGLNRLVTGALGKLRDEGAAVRFFHQSGEEDREWVEDAYRSAEVPGDVRGFVDAVGEEYRRADLVVSRSGAGAVSEIAAAGLPALFVPYPHAAGGHQLENARWLSGRGGAVVIEESSDDAAARLAGAIAGLAKDREKLRTMARRSREAGRRDAAEKIVDECRAMLGAQRG